MFRVCNETIGSGSHFGFWGWRWRGFCLSAKESAGNLVAVIERKDLGSWLEGPPSDQDYPGQHMGRPQRGPGSIARFGRRILAFILDWYLCWAILALAGHKNESVLDSLLLLGLVWAYQVLTVGFMGRTIGHMIFGLQVQTLDGRPIGWFSALLRSTLVMIVLPVLMMDADQRGIHDRIRHTILVQVR